MSRKTNIQFKGIQHTPSSVSDVDGSAFECVNLAQDVTDLKPMPMPRIVETSDDILKLEANQYLVAVHNVNEYDSTTDNGKHFVLYNPLNKHLSFIRSYDNAQLYEESTGWANGSDVLAVECVGNTIIASTEQGMEYFYWKYENNSYKYKYLGQKPPMPILQFKLSSLNMEVYSKKANAPTDESGYELDPRSGVGDWVMSAKNLKGFDEQVKGLISEVKTCVANDNRFFEPFFVRYAIRLKSGDHILHSSPVLIVPSSEICPFSCEVGSFMYSVSYINIRVLAFDLLAKFIGYEGVGNIDDWKDVVSSIDVFVTDGISNFDADTLDGNRHDLDYNFNGTTRPAVILKINENDPINLGKAHYNGTINNIDHNIVPGSGSPQWKYYPLESRNENVFNEDIKSTSIFRKFAKYDFNNLPTDDFNVVESDKLKTLNEQQQLKDDYNTHCALSPRVMQTYNARLNIGNIKIKAYDGYPLGIYPQAHSVSAAYSAFSIHYKLNKNGKEIVVHAPYGYNLSYTTYLFYPDTDCYECVVGYNTSTTKYLSISMTKHEYINGSYWYGGLKTLWQYLQEHDAESTQTLPTITNSWYHLQNRFSMSPATNPFYFPVDNMFDIGKREIRAIAVNTEDIANAQYGQNPIYIFCSDGLWSMKISGDGSFGGLSPLSSDVISRMDSLTRRPIAVGNQVVFFVTNRGLMCVSGSQVKDLGFKMNGKMRNPNSSFIPSGSLTSYQSMDADLLQLIGNANYLITYANFMEGASLVWDYKHSRVVAINKDCKWAFAYDMAYDFWSKMVMYEGLLPSDYEHKTRAAVNFVHGFGNYTEAYLQDNNGYIFDLMADEDQNDISEKMYGFYISRPMMLGSDMLKSITRIVHHWTDKMDGEFVKIGLYGSRDGANYYKIESLRGASYMYFIVVLYTKLYATSRYSNMSIELQDRLVNKLR